ncbi:hypothetical protein Tco_0427794 [Tanacetum coccineum]
MASRLHFSCFFASIMSLRTSIDLLLLLELERIQIERVAQEEASNATLIVEFDNVQARIEADALLAARLQEKKESSFLLMSKLDF